MRTNTYSYTDTDADGDSDTDANWNADNNADPDTDADWDTDRDADWDTDDNADADRDADWDTDRDADADANGNTDDNAHADRNAYRDADWDAHSDADRDAYSDTDWDAYSDADGDAYTDTDGDADSNTDGNSDSDADMPAAGHHQYRVWRHINAQGRHHHHVGQCGWWGVWRVLRRYLYGNIYWYCWRDRNRSEHLMDGWRHVDLSRKPSLNERRAVLQDSLPGCDLCGRHRGDVQTPDGLWCILDSIHVCLVTVYPVLFGNGAGYQWLAGEPGAPGRDTRLRG
jgi:hypothetical protein